MQIKETFIQTTRPTFFIQGKLPLEEGSLEMQKKDTATRLTLQILAEEIWHKVECQHCKETDTEFDQWGSSEVDDLEDDDIF